MVTTSGGRNMASHEMNKLHDEGKFTFNFLLLSGCSYPLCLQLVPSSRGCTVSAFLRRQH